MKRSLTLVALTITALLAAHVPANAAVPVPEQDPFYAVPANISSYANGDVIASRPISPSAFGIPLPAKAWQVKYRTMDSHDHPIATVTTVLVPYALWLGKGKRPIVSYQTAEDGVTGKCAPSYALSAGLPQLSGGFSNSGGETSVISLALLQGWALTVPDYEGPKSEFLVAKTEARGVLDGIRATQRFSASGLSVENPVALWGYSGGSFASSAAAQYQSTYAPELKLSGVALGGYVADIRSTIDKFSGSIAGGAVAMGINGFLRAYPELNIEQYLSESGKQKVAGASGDCLNDAAIRYPFLSFAQLEAVPNALDLPAVKGMLDENSPINIAGRPLAPVYSYHAILDEFAPIGPARTTLRRFCDDGTVVQNVEDLLGEHISELATGIPGAMQFLNDRFAGKAPINNCSAIPLG
jgi:hypothetical protein